MYIGEHRKMGNKNQDSDNENGYENGKGGDDEVRIMKIFFFFLLVVVTRSYFVVIINIMV